MNEKRRIYPTFDWIEDDNLLRDEGVMFGLSKSDTDQKVEAITQYYQLKIEAATDYLDNLKQRISELRADLEKASDDIMSRMTQVDQLTHPPEQRASLAWIALVKAMAYFGGIVLSFWLVLMWLGSSNVPFLVALGLYILGIFAVFNYRSFFYTSEEDPVDQKRPDWKLWVGEFTPPVAIAVFFLIMGAPGHSLVEIIAFSFIFLTLFLIIGKGLVSFLPILNQEMAYYQRLKEARRADRARLELLEQEISKLQDHQMKIRGIIDEKEEERFMLQSEIAGMSQQRAAKVALFLSEYNLTVGSKTESIL